MVALDQHEAVLRGEEANASRFEDAVDFVHHPRRIRHVLVDVGADDDVERCFRQARSHRIAHVEGELLGAELLSRVLDGGLVDIDPRHGSEMLAQELCHYPGRATDVDGGQLVEPRAEVVLEDGDDLARFLGARLDVVVDLLVAFGELVLVLHSISIAYQRLYHHALGRPLTHVKGRVGREHASSISTTTSRGWYSSV